MATQYVGMASAEITLFRGQEAFFQMNPVDGNGNPISVDNGTTGKLIVTTSLSTDANSVIHSFNDMTSFAGLMRKAFSQADTRLLPLGSFLFESRFDEGGAFGEKAWLQGTINVYPTQMG